MNYIHAWFEERVAQNPNAIAVMSDSQSVTYQSLNLCANRLALQLLNAGVTPDMRIALCVPSSIEQFIAIFAVLKAGGAYVPLDPHHSAERLQWLTAESSATILIHTRETKNRCTSFRGKMLCVEYTDNVSLAAADQKKLAAVYHSLTPHHLAYVIYTSGSTGTPKGVMIEHRSVSDYCSWFQMYTNFSLPQLVDYSNNYIFDFGITSSIVPLMLGATVVICTEEIKKDPLSYLKYLATHRINLLNITPSFFKEMIKAIMQDPLPLPHLQTLILGGENLSSKVCHAWLTRFPDHTIYNEYGPTEATVAILQHAVTLANLNLSMAYIPIGKPGPTMQTFIFDEHCQPVPCGEIGELYIGGTCLARGYLNQSELNRNHFIMYRDPTNKHDGEGIRLYKTGDLVKQNQNGEIEFVGRCDKQIKIRGYRVELNEIEIRLRQHEHIQDAVVTLHATHENEPQLVAYYILKLGMQPLTYNQLHRYLLTFLPEFMVPNALIQLESFPRTANDKLDERALPVPTMLSSKPYLAPRTATERQIAIIWAEELSHCHIGIQDNFFELGGHSLQAARIIANIAKQMDKKITVHDLYQAPTIEQIALKVEHAPSPDKIIHNTLKQTKALPLHDFQLLLWLSRFGGLSLRTANVVWRKRIQGPVDKNALDLALKWVLEKQEIFTYHIHLLYPLQSPCTQPQKQCRHWHVTSLSHLSIEASETYLTQHFDELFYKKTWETNSVWISADLFYLHHDHIELQICLSHMIADESCRNIFFQNLSHAYLFFTKRIQQHTDHSLQPYKNYIVQQHAIACYHAEAAAKFWTSYLQDAGSFHFPSQYILPNAEARSTQIALSESFVEKLRQFCVQHTVAINDVLSAALSLALLQCCDNDSRCIPHKLVIFSTKSTRDDPQYDKTIGCFLRVDPIKLEITPQSTLPTLAKQAQQSAQIGAPFQHASSLIKYASVGKIQLCAPRKSIKRCIIHRFFTLLAKFFPELHLDRSLFDACELIAVMDKTKQFLMNINMPSDFLDNPAQKSPSTLLGLSERAIPHIPFRNHTVRYMLDVFFLRDEHQGHKPYIVITSNLRPDFQQRLGETIASIIEGYS
jgi:amino acid adenylation domain-containing protein